MFKKLSIFLVALLFPVMVLAQNADQVKNCYLHRFPSKTIGQTMAEYPWFSSTAWQNVIMEDGKTAIICWNIVNVNAIKEIKKTSVKNLAIGYRFVFINSVDFKMDKIFIMYCTKSGFKDMFGVEEKIDQMYDEIYACSSRFILNVTTAIGKNVK
ncbi:MAG: hypothetical protein WC503_02815 [Candidatus Shapirobacteria bacterium]